MTNNTEQAQPNRKNSYAEYESLLHSAIPYVQQYARYFAIPSCDAEELAQEVLARLWITLRNREKHSLPLPEYSPAYIHKLVCHTYIDLKRKESRTLKGTSLNSDNNTFKDQIIDEMANTAEQIERSERWHELLGQLSPEKREIFYLYYIHGETPSEIGKKLCRSESSIKMLVHRAKEQLRKKLITRENE